MFRLECAGLVFLKKPVRILPTLHSLTLYFTFSVFSVEIDEVFPEDIQPEYHHVVELRHTRVIWKNCLILGFTL